MPSTVFICETNGAFPGNSIENIPSISWKSLDDSSTSYNSYNAVLRLSSNSYTVYNYLKFVGQFNSLGNVRITNVSGLAIPGLKLMAVPSASSGNTILSYSRPTRNKDNTFTSLDLTNQYSYLDLLVGPLVPGNSGPTSPGKYPAIANNTGVLYSNYFVTQLQVGSGALAGDFSSIVLQISYSET